MQYLIWLFFFRLPVMHSIGELDKTCLCVIFCNCLQWCKHDLNFWCKSVELYFPDNKYTWYTVQTVNFTFCLWFIWFLHASINVWITVVTKYSVIKNLCHLWPNFRFEILNVLSRNLWSFFSTPFQLVLWQLNKDGLVFVQRYMLVCNKLVICYKWKRTWYYSVFSFYKCGAMVIHADIDREVVCLSQTDWSQTVVYYWLYYNFFLWVV